MSPMPAKWKTYFAPVNNASSGCISRMSRTSTRKRDSPLCCVEILQPAADQAVDDMNTEALAQQQIHHVAADESRPAGDHRYAGALISGRAL